MIYYESGAMAREQKLERLKEIEKKIETLRKMICSGIFGESQKEELICLLKQEANKIGEELIGCGEEYPTEAYWDKTEKVFMKCEINNLCPTCQEANEILARINGN